VKAFMTSREIPASPQVIFESLSNSEKLAKWWGPDGFTNTFNLFQFENGGKWSFVMHSPDGKHYPNENEFIEIVAPEKVVIGHISEPKFTLTITITGSEAGSTVGWLQEFGSEEVARNISHIVVPSNEQNLDRLTAVVCGS
jgi:uncharacterized protein YndB with AHSA1/START domain